MGTHRTLGHLIGALLAVVATLAAPVALPSAPAAHPTSVPLPATCLARPWTKSYYQAEHPPAALATLVLGCLKEEDPATFRHDEVGIVALNADAWFQNVNEFGLTSTVQRQLARLGMPPITLEDGPGGLITRASPAPTVLPNELALGATFNPRMATLYGTVLGTQANAMGYDGVQAPDLNVVRVPTWGRAMESFGESPVLAGEMGAAEAVAIAARHEIPVLKHFGPYSQESDRKVLNQLISERAYEEVYIRPFTLALRALLPLLAAGHHAVGIMCSYGNVNATKACRSPELARELGTLHVDAFVRSDLDVHVSPTALLLNGVDLIKPMATGQVEDSLGEPGVGAALDRAVLQVFRTLFAAGLVNGTVTAAHARALPKVDADVGRLDATQIEEHAAVLLKDAGILPLSHARGRIAVVGDAQVQDSCRSLAGALAGALAEAASCTDPAFPLHKDVLFHDEPFAPHGAARSVTFTAPATGAYVATLTTWGDTTLAMDGSAIVASHGLAEAAMQRTALVHLTRGERYTFDVTWRGAPPIAWLEDAQPEVDAAIEGVHGARAAVVVAYDLSREGMDRSSLELPNAQDAVIAAVAARVPTVVVLATDGAVTMPWLSRADGVLEVWNPRGMVQTDATLLHDVPAWTAVLDGAVDPSGRLPETFPADQAESPAAVEAFWPGIDSTVDLGLPPNGGVGIGEAWYRTAGWPVLFPFGFGLSYTSFALEGGTVTSGPGGLQMTVAVKDTGHAAGTESVQAYADWPAALNEPRRQLVGFGTVAFTRAEAAAGTVEHAVLTLSPDALAVYQSGEMHVAKGGYCLEAATYDGDPRSWSTGTITLAPGADGSVAGPATTTLTSSSCTG